MQILLLWLFYLKLQNFSDANFNWKVKWKRFYLVSVIKKYLWVKKDSKKKPILS